MATVGKQAKGMPLSLVIVRYFAYVLVSLAGVWFIALAGLSAAIGCGAIYPANYGAANMQRMADKVVANAQFDPAGLSTPYRYAILDETGAPVQTTLSDKQVQRGLSQFAVQPAERSRGGAELLGIVGTGGATYALVRLNDGALCLLASDYLPHYVNPRLEGALPNPQNLMLVFGCAASAAAVALIARRASKVLARKMEPLTRAAEKIAREELSFDIEPGNVRQINEVADAMDAMRTSLKASLEQRFRSEQSQRDQIAALAHDLKTPLTVIMANADFAAEEARAACARASADTAAGTGVSTGADTDAGAPADACAGTPADACECAPANVAAHADDAAARLPEALRDIADATHDISRAARQADAYVKLLLDASRGDERSPDIADIPLSALFEEWSAAAAALARTTGKRLSASFDAELERRSLPGNAADIGRALSNVLANAFDHARSCVKMRFALAGDAERPLLAIAIADDGAGFGPEALERACERFYRDDDARAAKGGLPHYGIGLFVAQQTALAYGGRILLDNERDAKGAVCGALVTLELPGVSEKPARTPSKS